MAAIIRRVYIHKNAGMGTFKRVFGGRDRRGCTQEHRALAASGNIRFCLQTLEKMGLVAKVSPSATPLATPPHRPPPFPLARDLCPAPPSRRATQGPAPPGAARSCPSRRVRRQLHAPWRARGAGAGTGACPRGSGPPTPPPVAICWRRALSRARGWPCVNPAPGDEDV